MPYVFSRFSGRAGLLDDLQAMADAHDLEILIQRLDSGAEALEVGGAVHGEACIGSGGGEVAHLREMNRERGGF